MICSDCHSPMYRRGNKIFCANCTPSIDTQKLIEAIETLQKTIDQFRMINGKLVRLNLDLGDLHDHT